MLYVRIDKRVMFGKFNITKLSKKDVILLGKPWLSVINPDIDWTNDTILIPATEQSQEIEDKMNEQCRSKGVPPYLFRGRKSTIEEEEEVPFTPLKTLSKDANHCLEQI